MGLKPHIKENKMDNDNLFEGKRELDIDDFTIVQFKHPKNESILLDIYYTRMIKHDMIIILICLVFLLVIFLV